MMEKFEIPDGMVRVVSFGTSIRLVKEVREFFAGAPLLAVQQEVVVFEELIRSYKDWYLRQSPAIFDLLGETHAAHFYVEAKNNEDGTRTLVYNLDILAKEEM